MTLKLEDQYRLATVQTDFRNRVSAASFATAVAAFGLPPLATAQQSQRMQLVRAVINQPNYATNPFAWLIVMQTGLTDESGLTDAFISQQCGAFFDPLAQFLFPVTP